MTNALQLEYQFARGADAQSMLALFSSALAAAGKLEEARAPNKMEWLSRLDEDLSRLDALYQGSAVLQQESFYAAQLENVRFTLKLIRNAIEKDEKAQAAALAKYQLRCFLLELREEIYFWAYVYPWRERWSVYYQTEFAPHHRNEYFTPDQSTYEVSIFVPAKDKLDYTRQCIDSIVRETDVSQINYELILINHGSTDGTQAYFESIAGAKCLHFKQNVRMIMFSSALRVCEGRYAAFVSNDTVVTKDWLELLLRCIRSDPAIASVTPTTPNISNFQATPETYGDLDGMARFAAGFNQHDPLKWEQRARIMPVIALYDIEKINRIGFTDRYFRTMEFWDDDFSLRARRAGYKQILCRDVFCHHYGSVTGREAQVTENTLETGRRLFVVKHDVDPWENGAYYDHLVCTQLESMKPPAGGQAEILGVDCGFGDTLLQLANLLRRKQTVAQIDSITMQHQYADDLKTISRTALLADDEQSLLDQLATGFTGRQYNYIYLSRPLELYQNWREVLDRLCALLAPGGTVMVFISNALDSTNFQWFGSLAFPAGRERLNYLNPAIVKAHLQMRCASVWQQPKRGWASTELLAGLVKQIRVPWLPEEALIELMDSVGFQYFGTKEESRQ